MEYHIFPLLLLILTLESGLGETNNGFLISAPSVFHVGVKEKVFVQVENSMFNVPITLYLESGINTEVTSRRVQATCTEDEPTKTVELIIERDKMPVLSEFKSSPPYFLLVAESPHFNERKMTRVLVSKHRGYIFIQTDQPIYNPTQRVHYRIFTLDHTMRPHEEFFQLSLFNPAGNRVMKVDRRAKGGIYSGTLNIPDVSEMGTWKITAHYDGDKENAAAREFKVQKFVLPSFEVNIRMKQSYLLLDTEEFNLTISALYTYGEKVKGAFHTRCGVVKKGFSGGKTEKPVFLKGLESTGSVQDGTATVTLKTADINRQLQTQHRNTLSDLQENGYELYFAVTVTNIQSGELQEAEIFLPIVSQRYTIDLSRTRSFFIPGIPLDVVVITRLPDGSPAANVPVKINAPTSHERFRQVTTNQQGAVFAVFNFPSGDGAAGEVTIDVSITSEGLQESKVIQRASSPHGSYLYLSITNRMHTVGESLSVTYQTLNGSPRRDLIYYMVFSRGILVKHGSLRSGTVTKDNLPITPDMAPSFRLIGYYYNKHGDVIADSVRVDVEDMCQEKVKVSKQSTAELIIDLPDEKAKVALLAVDKAIYALKADNKLTAKQVFSSMQSYDLGCSYGGGADPESTINDAGLTFISRSMNSLQRQGFGCNLPLVRQRRSLDLQQEMMKIKTNYSSEKLQNCCVHGFTLIPMKRTCEERAQRVSQLDADPLCAEVFLDCCRQGEKLRQRKRQEDAQQELGRTASALDIEDYFSDTARHNIRRYFPPSFAFKVYDVNGKLSHRLTLPDSITTWEIQAISLSPSYGFCVAKPWEFRAFKDIFVSLRLPYSVKKYEHIAITPVIYNYKDDPVQLAVHMEQTKGLCSPGSATSTAFVNITMEPQSSQFVTFSAVPMVTGEIPIKIHIYDIEQEAGMDAIEKTLNVWVSNKHVFLLFNDDSFIIDGMLPDDTVPESGSNIFIEMEEDGFSQATVRKLLSPKGVAAMLRMPTGCAEQTMTKLGPTVFALRYLDVNQLWFELPVGTRDEALNFAERGYLRMLTYKKSDGSYGPWWSRPSSAWVTAHVVKVMSLVAERQSVATGEQGRRSTAVSAEEISQSVGYLLSVQKPDGSFTDPNPVMHRGMKVNSFKNEDASMTAFVTLALNRALQFTREDQRNKLTSILKATMYLQSHVDELENPYAVAIAAFCLSVCLSDKTQASPAWNKLQALATEVTNGCRVWKDNAEVEQAAVTVETTAYALLTAVTLGESEWADSAACWLTSQERLGGGFSSTQDTFIALEALSEHELNRPTRAFTKVGARFTVPGKSDKIELSLENRRERVESELKKMIGNNINVVVTGEGSVKLKVVKAYHLLEPKDHCQELSINVKVEGKVKYTTTIMENYDYYEYEDYDAAKKDRVPRSAIEWFDARTRYRRDTDDSSKSQDTVTYEVTISHDLSRNLTGMAIADITLLSGFEAVTEDLDRLKQPPEEYISHYEVTYGRVVIYFNELVNSSETIKFDAIQRVPIGLLQPAPATFYDYYEPSKCTVVYSAPKRSKMVSKLCSGDVCQCAERPCHKQKSVFEKVNGKRITLDDRLQHACFFPTVDYGYIIEVLSLSVKSNFELYTANVTEVLRAHGDIHVAENAIRVFAKRLQCKGQLETGKRYLIMGKDGTTTTSNGQMQYLLELNTWVEQVPEERKCRGFSYKKACKAFDDFVSEYKVDGCRQ
uniref:Complement C4B (Chido/Rodgers blood group) n=1 Tax=Myripristis murdjan TaxID=586833 RepID=A0A667Y137_9TELE